MKRPHEYYIDPVLLLDPNVQKLGEFVVVSVHDRDFSGPSGLDPVKEIEEYFGSECFRTLTEEERRQAMVATNRIFGGVGFWQGDFRRDDSGLFSADVPDITVPANELDALVLSGCMANIVLDNVDTKIKSYVAGLAGENWLRKLQLVGALAYCQTSNFGAGMRFVADRDNASVSLLYAGAMEMVGDPVVEELVSFRGCVIDPAGNEQPFAPVLEHREAHAHYVEELPILISLLRHFRQTADDSQRTEAYVNVRSIIDMVASRNSNQNFANLGESSGSNYDIARSIARLNEELETGEVISRHLVQAGSSARLEVAHFNDRLEMCMVGFDDNGNRLEKPPIRVFNDELVEYIAAYATAQQGRAALNEIDAILRILLLPSDSDRIEG